MCWERDGRGGVLGGGDWGGSGGACCAYMAKPGTQRRAWSMEHMSSGGWGGVGKGGGRGLAVGLHISRQNCKE